MEQTSTEEASGKPPSTRALSLAGRERYFPGVSDQDWNDWRWQFRHRVTTLEELASFFPIPDKDARMIREVLHDFRMGITPYYLSLIEPGNPDDPIYRQIVPLADEHLYREVGDEDPLSEEQYSPVPGITHRYPDRVLMVISNSCAVYCRYCTRKRIMYEGAVPDIEIDRMVDYIARTPQVRDVVVSGGDPLTYSTAKLERILAKLRAIPHLEIIRIGTRVPVSLPQRVDAELCAMLQKYHPLWVNVHFNHPNECTPEAAAACDRLSRAGIPLNNQAVLLRGVNDDVATMKALLHSLMKMRVRPYYLYLCDPVRGTEHLRTPISTGIEIMEGLRGHTSGLAIPHLVIDAPGGGGKIPVGPNYLLHYDPKNGRAILRNYQNRIFEYFEPRLPAAVEAAGSGGADAAHARSNAAGPPNAQATASPAVASGRPALAGAGGERGGAKHNGNSRNGTGGRASANGRANGAKATAATAAGAAAAGTSAAVLGSAKAAGAPGKRSGTRKVVGKSTWVHNGSSPAQEGAVAGIRDPASIRGTAAADPRATGTTVPAAVPAGVAAGAGGKGSGRA